MSNVRLVFIHGILSGAQTFDRFRLFLRMYDPALAAGAQVYEYDYHKAIVANGWEFARWLDATFAGEPDTKVAIVAHSMGGLVARAALLQMPLAFVTHLFMLGTPNFGALRPGQLSLLMQIAHKLTNEVAALFSEQRGIVDLSNIHELFKPLREQGAHLTDHVSYITIPGCFYHDSRNLADRPAIVEEAVFSVLTALSKEIGVTLALPHDGIVEERSNDMARRGEAGYWSEKSLSNKRGDGTCIHVSGSVCEELVHTEIHGSAEIVQIVLSILQSPSLKAWCATVMDRRDIDGRPPEMFWSPPGA